MTVEDLLKSLDPDTQSDLKKVLKLLDEDKIDEVDEHVELIAIQRLEEDR